MSNAFTECNKIGMKGEAVIDFLLRRYYNRVEETEKNIEKQLELADFVIPQSESLGIKREIIEVKTEEKWTGNLFFETVSNEGIDRAGWAFTSTADTFYYLFWDKAIAYRIPDFQAVMWNFDYCKNSFPERPHCKRIQHNKSKGKLVPIEWVMECYGASSFSFQKAKDKLYSS